MNQLASAHKGLEVFYETLEKQLSLKVHKKSQSLLFILLGMRRNDCYRTLLEASISLSNKSINRGELASLVKSDYVRETDKIGFYSITAKGIWQIESVERKSFENDDLIAYIDDQYFQVQANKKPLKENEKIVLFMMISVRTFSRGSSVRIGTNNEINEVWYVIVQECARFLKDHLVIGGIPKSISDSSGQELPISSIFRRLTDLPKKTRGVYRFTRDREYYLDIANERNELDTNKIEYLLSGIFQNQLSAKDIAETIEFLNKMGKYKVMEVLSLKERPFATVEFDSQIKKSFLNALGR